MLSTLGLPSPRKNWLLRSVLTTSLSTTNCTLRQNARCSSGVMESLAGAGRAAGGSASSACAPLPPPDPEGGWVLPQWLAGWASRGARPRELAAPDQPGPEGPQLALGP